MNKHFAKNIFFGKGKQNLLILALLGLFLSSFALLVLQSSMGGLQKNLIGRSKLVNGNYLVKFSNEYLDEAKNLTKYLSKKNVSFQNELELELLLKYKNFLMPVIAHGIDFDSDKHRFISDYTVNSAIPFDIAYKYGITEDSQIEIISPAHVDSFFDDIPRSITFNVDNLVRTDVPEVDSFHIWVKLSLLQNLIRKRTFNRIKVFSGLKKSELIFIKKNFKNLNVYSWDQMNSRLVWSLNLETTVMLFLFICMTLLVSLCITSGLMIFFNKIKRDLAAYWILGAPKDYIIKSFNKLFITIGLVTTVLGLLFGTIFLIAFDQFGPTILPDVFVDQKIPIYITPGGLMISFIIPFLISIFFSYISIKQFEKETDFMEYIRALGQG